MFGKFVSILAMAFTVGAWQVYATDLRVTDTKGNTVEVRDVGIDYTVYNILYHPDHEREGIRAHQGEGTVTIKWEQIDQVVIKRVKPGVSPRQFEAEITLKNKRVLNLDLQYSEKGLYGTTDLGDFKIEFDHVSAIVVLPARSKG